MTIAIYTTPTCPWCAKTKEFLKSKRIVYREFDVTTNVKAKNDMIRKSGQMGVPVLDIDGKIIVGYDPDAIIKAMSIRSPKKASKRGKARPKVARKSKAAKKHKKLPARKTKKR